MSASPDNTSKMVAYAESFTTGGTVKDLKYWWEPLWELGPKFGYYFEASKTWLILKNNFYDIAISTFKRKKISNTTFKSTKNKHNIKWDETTWGH